MISFKITKYEIKHCTQISHQTSNCCDDAEQQQDDGGCHHNYCNFCKTMIIFIVLSWDLITAPQSTPMYNIQTKANWNSTVADQNVSCFNQDA